MTEYPDTTVLHLAYDPFHVPRHCFMLWILDTGSALWVFTSLIVTGRVQHIGMRVEATTDSRWASSPIAGSPE